MPGLTDIPFRVGHGFDLHRLESGGKPFYLFGVEIEHDHGPVAHSDGDAGLHAVTDAILGALGEPDIGQIFPDSSPKWVDAKSSIFVREAVARMQSAGYEVGNLDVTVILERPRIGPFKDAMRVNLASLLDVSSDRVNVKGKSHERLDSLGKGLGVAVHAVVLLQRM